MDQSNFDVIKCEFKDKGCPFWHILITDGFKTKEEAQKEIKKIIEGSSFYSFVDVRQLRKSLRTFIALHGWPARGTSKKKYYKAKKFLEELAWPEKYTSHAQDNQGDHKSECERHQCKEPCPYCENET